MPHIQQCFVDLDTQGDFLMSGGALTIPGAEQIIPNLKALTDFASAHHIPIISSISEYESEERIPAGLPPHCMAGSEGAKKIPETLTIDFMRVPRDKREHTVLFDIQLILQKEGFDIFENANTEAILDALPSKKCVVYGVPAELTVRQTVARLTQMGYETTVVRDAILPLEGEVFERALTDMANAGAKFVNTSNLLQQLQDLA